MGRNMVYQAMRRGLTDDLEEVSLKSSLPYLKKCLPFLRPYIGYLLAGSACIVAQTIAGLAVPLVTMHIIDKVLPTKDPSLLMAPCLIWLALSLGSAILGVVQGYLFERMNQSIFHDIRTQVYRHMETLPLSYFQKSQTGGLMSRILYDVGALSGVFGTTITDLAINVLTIIVVAIVMFRMHWKLALVSMIIVPFFAYSFYLFRDIMKKIQKLAHQKWAELSGSLQERIAGIEVTKAFVLEDYEATKFANKSVEVVEVNVRRRLVSSLGGMINQVVGIIGPLVITWYGMTEIMGENLTLGQYFAFTAWSGRLMGPSRAIVGLLFGMQFSLGAAERVFEVLETPGERANEAPDAPLLPEDIAGAIEFKGVRFGYEPGREVIKGIDLSIAPGEKVALVGLSGAGKTTLAKLLLRFYQPQEGQILIDGYDINQVNLYSLRQRIGLIAQDTFLFNASLEENIRYGRLDATKEEIEAAAMAANAHEFIIDLPEGYDTVIGERGVTLSGGQRQRISIARAFLRDPRILILDEATSSLDAESERAIHDALDSLMRGRTTVIISHRLATLQNADRIYVLEDGRIVESGTHLELIADSGIYKHLFELQYLKTGTENIELSGGFRGMRGSFPGRRSIEES